MINKEVFVSYLDEEDTKKDVWVKVLEELRTGLKVQGNKNVLIIPYSRILKIKIRGEDGDSGD